jgi:putative ABC transport system ATP-binding protein
VTAVLAAHGIEKWWSPDAGLRPVSFEIATGEVVVVRGRSGSGKSTLLSLLAGWTRPDRGELVWCDSLAVSPRPWSGIAVVPQVLALVPELTVRENVEIALGRAGTDRSERIDRVNSTLRRLDLFDLCDRFPDEISMGQQQRTAIARAVVGAPVLVLADEPTSHQDPHHVEAVVSVLRDAASSGSAVLVATHEPAVVDAASTHIDLLT